MATKKKRRADGYCISVRDGQRLHHNVMRERYPTLREAEESLARIECSFPVKIFVEPWKEAYRR